MSSDCPTLVFTTDGRPDLLVLPLTPAHLFVAVRASVLHIVATGYTVKDAGWANAAQCYFSHRQLFSRRPFSDADRATAGRLMCERPNHNSRFENEDLVITTYSIQDDLPSFVARVAA